MCLPGGGGGGADSSGICLKTKIKNKRIFPPLVSVCILRPPRGCVYVSPQGGLDRASLADLLLRPRSTTLSSVGLGIRSFCTKGIFFYLVIDSVQLWLSNGRRTLSLAPCAAAGGVGPDTVQVSVVDGHVLIFLFFKC